MALELKTAFGRTAWRVRALFEGGDPSAILPSEFTVTRLDEGATGIVVSGAFIYDQTNSSLELILSSPIIVGVQYVLAWSTFMARFSLLVAPAMLERIVSGSSAEDEVYGVDLAWLSGELSANGSVGRRGGIKCLRYDLLALGLLQKFELAQAPNRGAGLTLEVNGPADDTTVSLSASKLEREWLEDDRISEARADITENSNGSITISGKIRTKAINEEVRVSNGGITNS